MGQALSLLVKCNALVRELAIYDMVNAHGLAVDLSHINTATKVTGHYPANDGLTTALRGSDIVVITCGVAQKVSSLFLLCIADTDVVVVDDTRWSAFSCLEGHIILW